MPSLTCQDVPPVAAENERVGSFFVDGTLPSPDEYCLLPPVSLRSLQLKALNCGCVRGVGVSEEVGGVVDLIFSAVTYGRRLEQGTYPNRPMCLSGVTCHSRRVNSAFRGFSQVSWIAERLDFRRWPFLVMAPVHSRGGQSPLAK